MRSVRLFGFVATTILTIALASPVQAAVSVKVIAKGKGHGSHPVAVMGGIAKSNSSIFLSVTGSPVQKVTVYWQFLCNNVAGLPGTSHEQGSSDVQRGKLTAMTPFTKTIARTLAGPPPCSTTIDVYGSKGGTLNGQSFQK